MRHRVFGNQLGRNTKQARALYRGLTREVLEHGRIETTRAKAKAIVGMVDKAIGLLKENSVTSRRLLIKLLGQEVTTTQSFTDRSSGYSRIIRLGKRSVDTADMVILELIEDVKKEVVPVKSEEPKVEKPVKKIAKKKNDNKTK